MNTTITDFKAYRLSGVRDVVELKWQDRFWQTKALTGIPDMVDIWKKIHAARRHAKTMARIDHIAMAFLEGKPYYSVEQKVMRSNLPKDIEYFWCLVATVVSFAETKNATVENSKECLEDVMQWVSMHPGYLTISHVLNTNESIPMDVLHKWIDDFGDFWMYITEWNGAVNEEKEAAKETESYSSGVFQEGQSVPA